jgi:sugar/nucleoside kinase (ribokinase family)
MPANLTHGHAVCSAAGTDGCTRSPAGAGDLFAAGFLYGLMRGYPLQRCARIGCLAGGAVVQSVGAELSPANWRWLFAR